MIAHDLRHSRERGAAVHSLDDTLAAGPGQSAAAFPHSPFQRNNPRGGSPVDGDLHSSENPGHDAGDANADRPVRRRISRACDQCNQLRTKCDGKFPCAHCVEFGLSCEYARQQKKRGKASKKDRAAQQAVAVAATAKNAERKVESPRSAADDDSSAGARSIEAEIQSKPGQGTKRKRSLVDFPQNHLPPPVSSDMDRSHFGSAAVNVPTLPSLGQAGAIVDNAMPPHQLRPIPLDQQPFGMPLPTPKLPAFGVGERGLSVPMGDYGSIDDYHRSILHPAVPMTENKILHSGASAMPTSMIQGGSIPGFGESTYGISSPNSQQSLQNGVFRVGESPLSAGFLGQSPTGNSPWLPLPSPVAGMYATNQSFQPQKPLRYPVLRPLLPHISAIIPINLACDLLELYFTSTTSAFMQPVSPYVLGYAFRKRSFLRQNNPRLCSPALLASMLWLAAQTSESAFLTSPPSARGKICQKLLDLTVGLLKPLIHTSTDAQPGYASPLASGPFGVALHGHHSQHTHGGSPGANGALDDVATYMHLAIVVSASEYKAASLRWWNAAWTLARELKLGKELPPNPDSINATETSADMNNNAADSEGLDAQQNTSGSSGFQAGQSVPGVYSEEEREERRRIWWLLYSVDRHLALCYNRPLALLDVECDGLFQPEADAVWQAGEYYSGENQAEPNYYRRRGPSFECTGHSLFGSFLPLMTILGEIVDLNHARNHPRFGLRFRNGDEWDGQSTEIMHQLEAYERSLTDFEMRFAAPPQPPVAPTHEQHNGGADGQQQYDNGTPSAKSVGTNHSTQRMTETMLQTKIVVAYGTHLMHTMYILLNGKWDPISLLDDNDLWISSQSFVSATGHAVSAAEAIEEILDYDPDLSFMPYFFGIYLLQSSFLLLLIADKLQGEANPSVVKACETIVRAHEACVVTLNTEYQRNFRKVMRSALSQVRGRITEDFGEQQLRRREVLALYRWTGDGTGLAL